MRTMNAITCKVPVGGVNSAAPATSAVYKSSSLCRTRRTHCCSEFLGLGIHASSSSLVFNLERLLVARQVIIPRRRQGRGANLVVRGLFGLGVPELAVIAGVAAILFGPKKLPEIGKSLGKTVKSFQQAAKEFEEEVKTRAVGDESTTKELDKPESPVSPTSVSTPKSTSTSSDKESA